MEEYDCHSSTENSPLGYQVVGNKPNNKKLEMEKRPRTKLPSRSNVLSHSKFGKSLSPPNRHSSRCQCNRCIQLQMTSSNDLTNQTGHWSETNLQNELGYMP